MANELTNEDIGLDENRDEEKDIGSFFEGEAEFRCWGRRSDMYRAAMG